MTKEAERFEDMSRRGRLRVIQQDDGDMIVVCIEDPSSVNGGVMAGVEFCTSGGKSPKTREALRALMHAMAADNADRQHCHRRGERGLGVTQEIVSHLYMPLTDESAPGARDQLRTFLDAAAGEGFVLNGVDAADLYVALFPAEYEAACAQIDPGVAA